MVGEGCCNSSSSSCGTRSNPLKRMEMEASDVKRARLTEVSNGEDPMREISSSRTTMTATSMATTEEKVCKRRTSNGILGDANGDANGSTHSCIRSQTLEQEKTEGEDYIIEVIQPPAPGAAADPSEEKPCLVISSGRIKRVDEDEKMKSEEGGRHHQKMRVTVLGDEDEKMKDMDLKKKNEVFLETSSSRVAKDENEINGQNAQNGECRIISNEPGTVAGVGTKPNGIKSTHQCDESDKNGVRMVEWEHIDAFREGEEILAYYAMHESYADRYLKVKRTSGTHLPCYGQSDGWIPAILQDISTTPDFVTIRYKGPFRDCHYGAVDKIDKVIRLEHAKMWIRKLSNVPIKVPMSMFIVRWHDWYSRPGGSSYNVAQEMPMSSRCDLSPLLLTAHTLFRCGSRCTL